MKWLYELNLEQQRAVKMGDGPVCIVAGPGTGKTKTITARIAYLLTHTKVKPQEIVALTFTNKAAREMRSRLERFELTHESSPDLLTFHGLCYKLLLDYQNASIAFINEPERTALIKELRKSKELKKRTVRELALMISYAKNLPIRRGVADPALAELLTSYNRVLKERDLYDFDDLLKQTYQLLHEKRIKTQYQYILVDEFQDTNPLQYDLLQLLRNNDNVCVIGDPLQSIYGFRGASGDVFERFKTDFPATQSVNLKINYRSTPQVVTLANAIFPHTTSLTAHRAQTGRVRTVEVLNEYAEASWIISQIEQAIGGSDFLRSHQIDQTNSHSHTFRDFAILYRSHHVAKTLQKMLAQSGIPYQVVGEDSPYEKPSIRAVTYLLCYMADPTEERRRSIKTLTALKNLSTTQLDQRLEALLKLEDTPLSELAYLVADIFQLQQTDLNQLTSTLMRFDNEDPKRYVAYVDTLNENDFYDPFSDAVSVMTIHAAKGLEFTHVFLLATEDGALPHIREGREADIEEEKRLFYVAVTRAENSLAIVHAKQRGGKPVYESRFIKDTPLTILPRTQDETMGLQQRRYQKHLVKRKQGLLFDL